MKRETYYLEVAKLTSERSTCNTKVGAVAVKDKRIIMTAYNGSPSGMKHCVDTTCHNLYTQNGLNGPITKHCIRTIHAEQNIITQCAKRGVVLNEAVIYCTHQPCFECQKLLLASGVKHVYYEREYEDERMLEEYKNLHFTTQIKTEENLH